MILQNWSEISGTALTEITSRVVNFIPNLLGAIIVFVIFWLVAILLEWAVENVLRGVGLQTLFEKAKIEDVVKKAESKRDTSGLIGGAVKWIVILVGLISSMNIIGLEGIASFLDRIIAYVPNVVGAAVILLTGAIFAHFMARIVNGSVKAARLEFPDLAASVTKYSILVFTFLAALRQLDIAAALIQTLFTGFVAAAAIACGLAFGLGGQQAARDFVEKLKKETEINK